MTHSLPPEPPPPKGQWVVFVDQPLLPRPTGGPPSRTPVAFFFARDESLARDYAALLWPRCRETQLCTEPADSVGYADRARARNRWLLDCDLAAQQFDFVSVRTGGRACRVCGCTDASPCPSGCWWVAQSLCSACCERAGVDPQHRASVELAGRDDTDPTVFPPALDYPPQPRAALAIRQACFALHAGDAPLCYQKLTEAADLLQPLLAAAKEAP